ncbi:MAG: bifunctional riboflavin kinase/FAD synthetase, partial [Gemmatimonadetes bacterium]|nr:bifunctional riboflavin kinase/FAD synthetase [Gemmatimonadota bacterium]
MDLFETFDSLADRLTGSPGTTVTIGVFDGLHQGHQALIRRTLEAARADGLLSLVITFQEHPLKLLAPPYCPQRLLDRPRKHALLASMGVDLVADVPFTREFADTPPEEFVDRVLAGSCRARRVICGYDFSFGRGGAGNIDLLRR